MSRKTEAWQRDMLMGTITPHIPNQVHDWEPYTLNKKIPCPKCGKMVELLENTPKVHYAATSNFICR